MTVFTFPIHICNYFNNKISEEKVAPILRLTLVCFQKVGLLYRRVGAGAAGAAGASAAGAEAPS
jgi:hypothetical protein